MGYRGKVREQEEARRLRAEGRTLLEIATILDVAKSSASVWVRDVPFSPSPRRTGAQRRPHPFHDAKVRRIAELNVVGRHVIGVPSDEAFIAAGTALYAGEGSKTDGNVRFSNSDPAMVQFFCKWLRELFEIDETRLRACVYLHAGLDLDAAEDFWSSTTGIPRSQFTKAYRAVADPTIRTNKHEHGCAYVNYNCSEVHRSIMGLVRALLSSIDLPG